ncbi:ketoacyl-ACP synthase III [Candidatus Haliotispira prima]|uniref:Beta-ketoacyl-[acyl-carrier-protein] synthase III n=1 Tax=Candidatus Haliotispira prima TaxID=3034016 RepID=A0ABY8MK25_9SPIO|nr:ketoacyl-ACP synthase III [Candidatus Haliotispira prima]
MSLLERQAIRIKALDCYVPERIVSNEELSRRVDTSDEWILSHTGIRQRHIATDKQASSDLGIEAARKALQRAGLQGADIDLVIVSSSAPDYYGFPSTACVVQEQLGCEKAAAFDITAACSGFVYGLQIGKSMLLGDSYYRNALIVAAEKLSAVTNWEDRSTAVLLGDGAGAVVLARGAEGGEILDSVLRADGSGAKALMIPEGGSRNPPEPVRENQGTVRNKLEMDGRAVYNFAVRANQEVLSALLQRNGLSVGDISYIVPHQANERIIRAVAKREDIPMERFYLNIGSYANTSSASIPIALTEMQEKNLLKNGDIILTVGFGSGLTYGGNLIRWQNDSARL